MSVPITFRVQENYTGRLALKKTVFLRGRVRWILDLINKGWYGMFIACRRYGNYTGFKVFPTCHPFCCATKIYERLSHISSWFCDSLCQLVFSTTSTGTPTVNSVSIVTYIKHLTAFVRYGHLAKVYEIWNGLLQPSSVSNDVINHLYLYSAQPSTSAERFHL